LCLVGGHSLLAPCTYTVHSKFALHAVTFGIWDSKALCALHRRRTWLPSRSGSGSCLRCCLHGLKPHTQAQRFTGPRARRRGIWRYWRRSRTNGEQVAAFAYWTRAAGRACVALATSIRYASSRHAPAILATWSCRAERLTRVCTVHMWLQAGVQSVWCNDYNSSNGGLLSANLRGVDDTLRTLTEDQADTENIEEAALEGLRGYARQGIVESVSTTEDEAKSPQTWRVSHYEVRNTLTSHSRFSPPYERIRRRARVQ
jgi:hypothetical protein